jgi:hypothetical protein
VEASFASKTCPIKRVELVEGLPEVAVGRGKVAYHLLALLLFGELAGTRQLLVFLHEVID